MLLDAAALPDGSELSTDVCVVGAGPAGITVALRLAAAGTDVLLVDSGGAVPGAASTALSDADSVGAPYFPVGHTRARAIGGTSHTWPWIEGWRARPLDPIDFERREGLPFSGWPLSGEEIARHLPEAHALCDLDPGVYEPRAWTRGERCLLPLDEATAETAVFRYSRTTFARHHDALVADLQVRLLPEVTVTRLVVPAESDAVRELHVATLDGRRLRLAARRVVLAGGGIENARLLLWSGLDRHDLVGRFFMERLVGKAAFARPLVPDLFDRLGFYGIHRVDDLGVQGVLTLPEAVRRREGLLGAAFFLDAAPAAMSSPGVASAVALARWAQRGSRPPQVGAHVRTAVRDMGGIARAARSRLRRGELQLLLRVQAEPSPNPQSRIRLSRRRDVLGQPLAEVDWRVHAEDREHVRRSALLVGDALETAGLARIVRVPVADSAPQPLEGAHHHVGTTRMADSPLQGVVDADCRVHGLANCWIAGSSVFPTAGYANPTLTLVALAVRLADRLSR